MKRDYALCCKLAGNEAGPTFSSFQKFMNIFVSNDLGLTGWKPTQDNLEKMKIIYNRNKAYRDQLPAVVKQKIETPATDE